MLTKLEPSTVMVIGLEVPATALAGEMEVTPDAAIVNGSEFEGTALTKSVTTTEAVPADANKPEGMLTVMEVELLILGVSPMVVPFVQFTMGTAGKLVPVSTMLVLAWPAVAEEGFRLLSTGLGLMVNVAVVAPVPVPFDTPT